ncbi:hypothetical protein AB0B45_36405 [Nonomuraea sp. NPDC049152]|uniref:hypothetical protein n=1 Tax=Nonomuraea sp. NPDC049152 TaxID=3154350 RepID=UPI003411ED65
MTTFSAGIKLALFALVTTACVAVLAITISGAQFTPALASAMGHPRRHPRRLLRRDQRFAERPRRLSETIASRDDKLHELVRNARTVTGLLADRDERLRGLVRDGGLLLREIIARRAAIHGLLTGTVALAEQIDGLIADNRDTLKPALKELRGFVAVLRRNERDLDRSLALLIPFARQLADATGNGPWFDSIIQNLIPVPASVKISDLTLGGLAPCEAHCS